VELSVDKDATRPPTSALALVTGMECYVPLEGVVDLEGERRRLAKELGKTEESLRFVEEKLSRDEFRARAPAEVVEREIERREELARIVRRLSESLERIREAER
jgi:valyl-tRNA synthetase